MAYGADIAAETGTALHFIDDLQIWLDGDDVTNQVLAQVRSNRPVDEDWSRLGLGGSGDGSPQVEWDRRHSTRLPRANRPARTISSSSRPCRSRENATAAASTSTSTWNDDGSTVRYALLHDECEWIGDISGLTKKHRTARCRSPAYCTGIPIVRGGPFESEPSGIAAYSAQQILIADTDGGRILFEQRDCKQRFARAIGGTPTGLAISGDLLYVADAAGARVLCFTLPSLELREVVEAGFSRPTGVAVDSARHASTCSIAGSEQVMRINRRSDCSTPPTRQRLTAPRLLTIRCERGSPLRAATPTHEAVFVIGLDSHTIGATLAVPECKRLP